MIRFSAVPNLPHSKRPSTWVFLAFEKSSGFLNVPAQGNEKIRKKMEEEGFQGKEEQAAVAYPSGGQIQRIIALGLGPQKEATPETLRRAGGRLARKARELRVEEIFLEWPKSFNEGMIKAFAEGVLLGSYQFNRYKTQVKDSPDRKSVV